MTLMTSVVLEFEAQSEYALDVTAADSQGHAVVKVLTVIVTDTNDPPTVSMPSAFRGLLCALRATLALLIVQSLDCFPRSETDSYDRGASPELHANALWFVGGTANECILPGEHFSTVLGCIHCASLQHTGSRFIVSLEGVDSGSITL